MREELGYNDDVYQQDLSYVVICDIGGAWVGSDELWIKCSNGDEYIFGHPADCCDKVVIQSVTGSLQDLLFSRLHTVKKFFEYRTGLPGIRITSDRGEVRFTFAGPSSKPGHNSISINKIA